MSAIFGLLVDMFSGQFLFLCYVTGIVSLLTCCFKTPQAAVMGSMQDRTRCLGVGPASSRQEAPRTAMALETSHATEQVKLPLWRDRMAILSSIEELNQAVAQGCKVRGMSLQRDD